MTQLEAPWRELRQRWADHVSAMEEDDIVVVELESGDELEGLAPYVQLVAWGVDMVRLEAVSNNYLDDCFILTAEQEQRLLDLGWLAPTWPQEAEDGEDGEDGEFNFHLDVPVREADRVAAMCVGALVDVYGCLHPAFLISDQIDVGGLKEVAGNPVPPAPLATIPHDAEHLRALVDEVLAELVDDQVEHDFEGDVPVPFGSSMVYVRVCDERPVVELFGWLVVDLPDIDEALGELAGLAAQLPYLQVTALGDRIIFRHEIVALPFAPMQLRIILNRLSHDLDDAAADVAGRLGGRRFLEQQPDEDDDLSADEPQDTAHDTAVAHELMATLELLHDGPVEPELVAVLFDQNRQRLVTHLVGLRIGTLSPGEHDLERVLTTLRAGLRHIVERQARREERRTGRPLPPRPARRGSRQLSLLGEEDSGLDTLDPDDESLWG